MNQVQELRNRARSLALVLVTLGSATAAHAGQVTVDAGRGPVSVQVPSSYDPAVPMPLVMLLHGYGASGAIQEAYMQFGPLAETRGFLYLAPNGTIDGAGNRFWNATSACCDFGDTSVDDSAYLRALIEAVGTTLSVDPRRIYLIGHSNGGFMSYRMACDHPALITAIASLAGATWNNPAQCSPGVGVPVLQIHGTNDTTILYGGGSIFGVPYPGAVATVEQWATFAGCSLVPDNSAAPLNLDSSIPGPETLVSRYATACSGVGLGELWTIQGGSHTPALSGAFAPAVIDFLFQHTGEGLGSSYCTGAANSAGPGAHLTALGSTQVTDDDFTLLGESLPASAFGLFFFGPNAIQAPFGDGFRCVGGLVSRLQPPSQANAHGTAARAVSFATAPAAGLLVPGSEWNFQLWYRDPMGPGGSGFNLSDGRTISFR